MSKNEHEAIMYKLGMIEGKLETLPKIENHLAKLNGQVSKHQTFIDNSKGKMAVFAGIVSAIVAVVISFINKNI